MEKKNCWEMAECGRCKDCEAVVSKGVCPAATESAFNGINGGKNGGRICWQIAGTFCKGEKQGTFAEKFLSCMNCSVFKKIRDEEGSDFLVELT